MAKGATGVDSETVFANYQNVASKTFAVSLVVEFLGVMFFQFLGGTVKDPVLGPFVNAFALTVWSKFLRRQFSKARIATRYIATIGLLDVSYRPCVQCVGLSIFCVYMPTDSTPACVQSVSTTPSAVITIGMPALTDCMPWSVSTAHALNPFLAVLRAVYTAANISGGHLNPAVTISTFSCGFYPALHSLLYVMLQVGR